MALDYGCHFFDSNNVESTDFFADMAGGNDTLVPVDVAYGNVYRSQLTVGLAVPDLSLDAEHAGTWFVSLLESISEAPGDATTLLQAIEARFGKHLAIALLPILTKVYTVDTSQLGAETLANSLFKRIRFLPDAVGELLKAIPALDEPLAVTSAERKHRFHPKASTSFPRNFYPRSGGMRGFVTRTCHELAKMGVQFQLGAELVSIEDKIRRTETYGPISQDLIISTLSPINTERLFLGTNRLAGLVSATPMALFFFQTSPEVVTDLHY